jgi:hypothetical protein
MAHVNLQYTTPLPNQPSGFEQWGKQTGLTDGIRLIGEAYSVLAKEARDCGIDWDSLQSRMPGDGVFLKGGQVPVLDRRDRGRCAFVWHLWADSAGNKWPLLIFMTFHHGGIQRVFYGYRWAREAYAKRIVAANISIKPLPRLCPRPIGHDAANDDSWRLDCYLRHTRLWNGAGKALPANRMLAARLGELTGPELLDRLDLRARRENGGDVLMVKLLNHDEGRTGYQILHATPQKNRKQTVVIRRSGLKRGSMVCVRAKVGHEHWPVAICEGVFTGLSVAAYWPGPVAVALDAGNLKPVRNNIERACVFFADNDSWGEQNTGLIAAQQAMRSGDRLVIPLFAETTGSSRPSDFNDLLQHEGSAALARQVIAAWPENVEAP